MMRIGHDEFDTVASPKRSANIFHQETGNLLKPLHWISLKSSPEHRCNMTENHNLGGITP